MKASSQRVFLFFHVAETEEGRIVGFVDGGKERSHPEKGIGEIYAIYLLKEFQMQGIGGSFLRPPPKFDTAGMKSIVVGVLDNSPNQRSICRPAANYKPALKL